MFSGTTITLAATAEGAITATAATPSGLVNKNVNYSSARFDTPDGMWPAEGGRNASRYVQFAIPVTAGRSPSIDLGRRRLGGGSNTRWDIVYALTEDFSAPTALGTALRA